MTIAIGLCQVEVPSPVKSAAARTALAVAVELGEDVASRSAALDLAAGGPLN
jgi:hypothetical protein